MKRTKFIDEKIMLEELTDLKFRVMYNLTKDYHNTYLIKVIKDAQKEITKVMTTKYLEKERTNVDKVKG